MTARGVAPAPYPVQKGTPFPCGTWEWYPFMAGVSPLSYQSALVHTLNKISTLDLLSKSGWDPNVLDQGMRSNFGGAALPRAVIFEQCQD